VPRAKRHYLPGFIWHLTHRCHKREFLLEFCTEKESWLRWIIEGKKRFGLRVLDYIVTSNHVHLLVHDRGIRDAIPRTMHLAASRAAQEYNYARSRHGAFWEDRYHSTAIEAGVHLIRCLTYIDLNMVRAGVVKHPSEWPFAGYHEIQGKPVAFPLVDLGDWLELLQIGSIDLFRWTHMCAIKTALEHQNLARDKKWTETVAVGTRVFVELIQKKLGGTSRRNKIAKNDGGFELR